jgi:hypothetical protein
MSSSNKVCPECSNEPSFLFKCYTCDKIFCEQCTLSQKIDVTEDMIEIKYFCPKCNSELHKMINIAKYTK